MEGPSSCSLKTPVVTPSQQHSAPRRRAAPEHGVLRDSPADTYFFTISPGCYKSMLKQLIPFLKEQTLTLRLGRSSEEPLWLLAFPPMWLPLFSLFLHLHFSPLH